MAFRCINLLKNIRCSNAIISRHNLLSTAVSKEKSSEIKEFKTENNITYLGDPDTFGTLSGRTPIPETLEDEGDLKEEQYLQNKPLKSQQLTTKQYADLIKQYLKHKRLNEAIDVLETRMLKEDRVKPENYIYNILIGACAEVGYTKKAFKLFNDMKRRALKPTGDTYTCLFQACINSPWPADGFKLAHHLRNHMIEKGIEPNLTNYNVMIKAFGRCSDLPTAFKIVDEMISKKMKIRVHTFNHLIQACISDKNYGLKHALIVWRKMLKMREKPNIYSFNLMLKCVKDCNLGSKADLLEVVSLIQEHMALLNMQPKVLQIEYSKISLPLNTASKHEELNYQTNVYDSSKVTIGNSESRNRIAKEVTAVKQEGPTDLDLNKGEVTKGIFESRNQIAKEFPEVKQESPTDLNLNKDDITKGSSENGNQFAKEVTELKQEGPTDLDLNKDNVSLKVVENYQRPAPPVEKRTAPNLLSKVVLLDKILGIQEVHTPQDKFAIIGGQDDFLKEMEVYSVKPDLKTFTQMLPVIEDNTEAEDKLLETMQSLDIKTDIDFYNALIKKRCFRQDYDSALDVREMIDKENKRRKRHPLNKKHHIKVNIMTYGVLALGCKTKDKAEALLNEMNEKQFKVNIEILGTLLKNATFQMQFGYILYVMDIVKKENIRVNDAFIKHLEIFNDRCQKFLQKNKAKNRDSPVFAAAYNRFSNIYTSWLKDINVEEALKPEHPWKQFMEPYPIPVQRENFKIVEPKKFYKKNRKFVKYSPKL